MISDWWHHRDVSGVKIWSREWRGCLESWVMWPRQGRGAMLPPVATSGPEDNRVACDSLWNVNDEPSSCPGPASCGPAAASSSLPIPTWPRTTVRDPQPTGSSLHPGAPEDRDPEISNLSTSSASSRRPTCWPHVRWSTAGPAASAHGSCSYGRRFHR